MPVIKVCGRFVSYGDGKWPQDLIMGIGSSAHRLVTGRSGGTSDLDRADGDHCIGTREGPGHR
jgi:hypothetical protein